MSCPMGLRWYVRWQAKILIGQPYSPLLNCHFCFGRLLLLWTWSFRMFSPKKKSNCVLFHHLLGWVKRINPNPHCFIAITKATACGWKEPLLPHPLHTVQPCEGEWEGGGGASSTDLLNKMWVTLKLSSKAYWKWHF
jgi:hypothetical protein